jgi:AcrR family transcriptional regulator
MPPALARESVEKRQVSRKVRSEERREQVLERMTDVFAKRGYQAATVDHLIAGGKISMGGFYKEFDGKEDCFVAVYDRVMDELGERLAEALPAGADWGTRGAIGFRTVVEFAAEKPLAARVVLLEAQTGGADALGRYTRTLGDIAGFLRAGRAEGDAAAALPASFEEATASGLAWLLQSRLAKERIEDPGELWPRMAKMALEPYLGGTRADQILRAIA